MTWTLREGNGAARNVTVERAGALTHSVPGWASAHVGMMVQTLVFGLSALLLLLLRSEDMTASLCVLALALSAVASGGPLLGTEGGFLPLGGC